MVPTQYSLLSSLAGRTETSRPRDHGDGKFWQAKEAPYFSWDQEQQQFELQDGHQIFYRENRNTYDRLLKAANGELRRGFIEQRLRALEIRPAMVLRR